MKRILCWFGMHRYHGAHQLVTLKCWYTVCERCGRFMKIAEIGTPDRQADK